jgi:hypothetical protein
MRYRYEMNIHNGRYTPKLEIHLIEITFIETESGGLLKNSKLCFEFSLNSLIKFGNYTVLSRKVIEIIKYFNKWNIETLK